MKRHIMLCLFLALCLPYRLSFAAGALPCPGTPAVIAASHQVDRDIICEAVQRTIRLIQRYDLETPPRLDIKVVDRFQDPHATERFGEFDPFAGKVQVMSSASCQRAAQQWQPFGQPMSRMLYRSLIIHELAHAVAEWNFRIAEPGILAHEYFAYVFQIDSMPPNLQQAILKQIDVPAFLYTHEINETYYGLNPDYFGVKSYRHFLQAQDKKALFRRLLAGELIPANLVTSY
jgi:hypothetical protein